MKNDFYTCICCLTRTDIKKLEDGYCPTCIRAGMRTVGQEYMKQNLLRQLRDPDRG